MDYKSVIESRYNREAWEALLHDIFLSGANFRTTPIPVDAHSPLVSESLQLGTITLKDDNKIAVYEIKLSNRVDIVENRVGIRNLLFSDWKFKGCAGAFIFCYRDNESVLRFSYVSQTFAFGEDGKMAKEETDTKRFTYILGEGHRSRTAIGQFENLKSSSQTLKDLTKAFSLDAVSDRFFDDYKEVYEDIVEYVTGKRYVKVANKWEEKVIHAPNEVLMAEFSWYEDPEKTVRDYVKRLMSRIVFLQFIQKKGWLGVPVNKEWGEGDKEFLQHLYEKYENKDNFIDGILELLFEDINHKRENDIANFILGRNIKVPYLNGGLFERDSVDERSFRLPRTLMDKMMNFFSSYNFTIDENDPDDAEIGVDPEMLGRIFENLLEDNKDKGAFYTPKEIVQYMCQESLIAYLQQDKSNADAEAIRAFVTSYDASALNESLKQDIDTKLKTVKICDPAIGSGAFPMGLLKELFACRSAIEGLSEDNAAEIKKHIIQNNIYGVDIEKGAVEIARLRFWLAIIVDEKTPHALPNMDFKIMRGNSLLECFRGIDLSGVMNNNTNQNTTEDNSFQLCFEFEEKTVLDQLIAQINEYFTISEHEQKEYVRNNIGRLVKEYIKAYTMDDPDVAKEIADMEIPNKDFFLWHTFFGDVFKSRSDAVSGGFDIVVGNPPYVSSATQMASEFLASQRSQITHSLKYNCLHQKWDLYIPFMELSLKYLLKNDGIFSMIVPYPLTNQIYAKKLREYILSSYDLLEIVDLSGIKVFENATVTNCIPFVRKSHHRASVVISTADNELTISKLFELPYERLILDKKSFIWTLSPEEKMIDKFVQLPTLGDLCYISKGMVLYSEDGLFTNEDLVSEIKDSIHCREYIEAKDMDSYAIKRIRYIEYDTDRVPDKVSRPTFRELYTQPKLLFNCLGQMKVSIDESENFICQQGIRVAVLWNNLSSINNKSITTSIKRYSTFSRKEMEVLSANYDLCYLLGVLNTRIAQRLFNEIRGGDYHVVPEHIRQIPIPRVTKQDQGEVVDIVRKVLAQKKRLLSADTSQLEDKIESLVLKHYNMSIVNCS